MRTVVSGVRVADRRKWVIWTDWLTRGLTQKYVAVSRHVADVHTRLCGISGDKITVIHNGVDIPKRGPIRTRQQNSEFRVLFVGRLTEQKQPVNLVRAVAAMPDELRNRTVVDFLGEGTLWPDLEREISRAGLEDRVRLRGYQWNVTDWMAQADVLALPSAWEGLPNAVLEAMACGLPVVASRVDGVSEIIESGVTGWLVPPGDVQAFANVLTQVASDWETRQAVAGRAFELVRQRFLWDSTVDDFDKVLTDLLEH